MSEWQNKSDFEINEAVTELINKTNCDGSDFEKFFADARVCELENGSFDPCNDPSDAWPIILENQISIFNSDNDLWSAQKWVSDKRISHEFVRGKNALRAAMIVLLEMNGVKP